MGPGEADDAGLLFQPGRPPRPRDCVPEDRQESARQGTASRVVRTECAKVQRARRVWPWEEKRAEGRRRGRGGKGRGQRGPDPGNL